MPLLRAATPPSTTPTATAAVACGLPPHSYLIERIGQTRVTVTTLIRPGANPHSFEPTPGQIATLGQARVYFKAGVEFEEILVPKLVAMFPQLKIVDLREGIKPLLASVCASDHDHAEHEHAPQVDPHQWLAPLNASIQAEAITRSLIAIDGAGAALYQANLTALQAELGAVHAELSASLKPYHGRSVYVYHPAFGYFCEAYGLKQIPVEIEGREPSPRQLSQLIASARDSGTKVIFVQPQFNPRSAEIVAKAIGGVVVEMDDLSPNYIANLHTLAARLKSAFGTR
ncbi:MAG: zinc ABC transporter substrate-binding protein [Verrucomicrobiota bacterium]|nr:zinc ABC transporter substrate-binding protein [Verrucomicrobiota bacterium]